MASEIVSVALTQLWQLTLLILTVAAVSRWLIPQRPHLSHLLWLVVLIKCVTPPLWASSGGIFCWMQPGIQPEPAIATDVQWSPVVWSELVEADHRSASSSNPVVTPVAGVIPDDLSEVLLKSPDDKMLSARTNHRSSQSIRALLGTWFLASFLVLAGVTMRWLWFWRSVRNSPRRDSPELAASLRSLSRQLGLRRRVRLIVTESLVGPAVVGCFRVTVLIPAIVVDRLSTQAIRPILAHELLHVRRGDLWVGLLQTLAQALWWFHPLVWWVGRVTSREAERCCDEEVLGELSCDPAGYARALLDVLDLKSQLKPVPVFPGVRPVDVTSNRLERIMSLRQGCRRRSPWWCWLVAIGFAASTLPGAAFVVTAQDELLELTENSPVPAVAQAGTSTSTDSGSVPHRPGIAAEIQYAVAEQDTTDRDNTLTTVVYDTSDFDGLLTGTADERQQKFEQLARSRNSSSSIQINWFDGKPVVRATKAVHRALRKCLAMFVENEATPETFDAFLESLEKRSDATLICDLQLVTPRKSIYDELRKAILADTGEQGDRLPMSMSSEKWDALINAIPSHDGYCFVAPQLAVYNGTSVMAQGTVQYGIGLNRDDDDKVEPCMNWAGWKSHLLPFQQNDGSFWLGAWIDNGAVVGRQPLDEADAARLGVTEPVTVHEYETFRFAASLDEGQVLIVPGLRLNHDDETPRETFLSVRVRRLPEENDLSSAATTLLGHGIDSDAGVQGEAILDESATEFRQDSGSQPHRTVSSEATPSPPEPVRASHQNQPLTRRRLGSLRLSVSTRDRKSIGQKFLVLLEDSRGLDVLSGSADIVKYHSTEQSDVLELQNARLVSKRESGSRFSAKHLRLLATSDSRSLDQMEMELESADVQFDSDGQSSRLSADRMQLLLNATTLAVEKVSAERVRSLRPVSSTDSSASPPDLSDQPARRVTSFPAAESARNKTLLTLRQQVSISFTDTPLIQVVESLANRHRLNIVLDVRGLNEEGLTERVPVSIELEGITLRSALRIMLQPLNLVTTVDDDGVVIVTSSERGGPPFLTAVYPVADLVIPIPDQVSIHAHGAGTFSADRTLTGKELKTAPSEWKRRTAEQPSGERSTDFDFRHLTELITQTIQPDSWQEVGGPGMIQSNESTFSLVIRQTEAAHHEISKLLGHLRRLRDVQVTLRLDTLELSPQQINRGTGNVRFDALGNSTAHRYARLTSQQAEQLRNSGLISQSPKVTLFNGQICHWHLGEQSDQQSELHIQVVASQNNQSIRLALRAGPLNDDRPLPPIPAITSGDCILLEVSGQTETRALADEQSGSALKADDDQQETTARHFLLIQPDILVLEEENVLNRFEGTDIAPSAR